MPKTWWCFLNEWGRCNSKGACGYALDGQKIPKTEAINLLKTDALAAAKYQQGKNKTAVGSLLLTIGGAAVTICYVQPLTYGFGLSSNTTNRGPSAEQTALLFLGGLASAGTGAGVLVSGIRNKPSKFTTKTTTNAPN